MKRFHQRGFNLIELMIAMAIGLVLIAGTLTVFSANSTAFRMQRTVSDAQEAGRFALDFIAKDIRRAGLGYEQTDVIEAGNDVTAVATATGLLAPSDTLTVRYQAPEATTDCEGNAAAVGDLIVNSYFVRTDNGLAGLFCDGSVITATGTVTGANGTSLIRGVESFQVLYGLAERDPDVVVNGFGQAVQYSNTIPAGMRVVSVRLGLLVRGEEGVAGMADVATPFPVLDSNVSADAVNAVRVNGQPVVHRLFSTTVALRNLLNVVPGG